MSLVFESKLKYLLNIKMIKVIIPKSKTINRKSITLIKQIGHTQKN